MDEWKLLTLSYSGWTLTEIRELSSRERKNWLEVAREHGKVVVNNG
jgi:hypothetical protein